jgi:hypothetical protein
MSEMKIPYNDGAYILFPNMQLQTPRVRPRIPSGAEIRIGHPKKVVEAIK